MARAATTSDAFNAIAEPQRRLILGLLKGVLLHGDGPADPRSFTTTVTFVERGNRTEVTMRALFKTKEQRDEVVERFGAIEGGRQTLERLAGYLAASVGNTGHEKGAS